MLKLLPLFQLCKEQDSLYVPLIGLLGAIIGSLVSGSLLILSSHLQDKSVKNRERNKLILEKLETLFETIEELKKYYGDTLLTFHRYLIGTEAVPIAAPTVNDFAIRILGLQSFYAPSLKDKLNQLITDIQEFNAWKHSAVLFLHTKSTDSMKIKQLMDKGQIALNKINKSCMGMQEELANLSKDYLK